MDLWKYYDGKLKYPNVTMYSYEKEIAKTTPKMAYLYVKRNGKNEDLEPIIAKDAKYSYWYARSILKGPFKLGEPAIAKDIEFSYLYVKDVLESRFELVEPTIAKDSYYSYAYAKNILEAPFKLGEPEIAKDSYYSKEYTRYVLKKDFYLDGKLICKYES